jgi:plastocyanin
MRVKVFVALGFSAALLAALAAPVAAGGGGGGYCGAVSEGASLAIRDFCFDGAAHVAEPGQTVNVVNYGETAHDVTSSDGSFASGVLTPGETFKVTLGSEPVVRYYCTLHGSADGTGMAGVFVVSDAGSGAAAPGAPGGRASATEAGASTPVSNDATVTRDALDASLAVAAQSAKTDATVALVVVTIIGMAVAFGLGLMVWAAGRFAPSERKPHQLA